MKKFVSGAVLFVLFLTLIFVIFSCTPKSQSDINTNTTDASSADTQESNTAENQTTQEARIKPDLPDVTFKGYEFKIMYRGPDSGVWECKDVYSEAENGDAINDAVYLRNKTVEDRYNIKIKGIPASYNTISAAGIKKSVQAGSNDYDAIMLRQAELPALVTSGFLYDISKMPYIDLNKPWWDKNIAEQLSIDNKVFATTGALLISSNNACNVIFFNKKLIKDFSLDDPYKLVGDNLWNMNKFAEMCKNISADLNNDGVFDENDRYGCIVRADTSPAMYYAAGSQTTDKDDNGIPAISFGGEKDYAVLNRIIGLLADKTTVMLDGNFTGLLIEKPNLLLECFANNQGLFYSDFLQSAEYMRGNLIKFEFGILPMPKYDENQSDYYSFAESSNVSLLTIPVTSVSNNESLKRTGVILEAMAAESEYTLKLEFYKNALRGYIYSDSESSEMLDKIIKNKVISLDETYGWGIHTVIQENLSKLTPNFASSFEAALPSIESKMNTAVDAIKSIGN